MKAFVCCLLFAAALAAPKEGDRNKRGLVPAAGIISPYGLGLGYAHSGLYGGLGYGSLGLGYGSLGYGGLGYGGLGYGGLGHHLHVPVLAVAVSKKVGEEPSNHKVGGEKKILAVPELHAVHAYPALPIHAPLGLHGLPLGVPAIPAHGLW